MTTTVDGPVRAPDDDLAAADTSLTAAPRSGGDTRLAGGDDPHHARRWLILAVLGIAQLMVVLDATIVNIALPTAQQALNFSNNDRQWIITAYALAFGSLLLLGGRIADIFGRKRAFLVGLVGFAIASAVGGAATSFAMLAPPAHSRARSARYSHRRRCRCSRRRSPIRASATRRSASTAPSPVVAARSACSSVAC